MLVKRVKPVKRVRLVRRVKQKSEVRSLESYYGRDKHVKNVANVEMFDAGIAVTQADATERVPPIRHCVKRLSLTCLTRWRLCRLYSGCSCCFQNPLVRMKWVNYADAPN